MHQNCHRSPAQHHSQRRPDSGLARWRDCRARYALRIDRAPELLREPGPVTIVHGRFRDGFARQLKQIPRRAGGTVMRPNGYPWGLFGILLAGAVCGLVASFPFVFSLYAELLVNPPVPLPVVLLLSMLQNTVILALLIGVGLILTAKVGLPGAPLIEDWRSGKSTGERLREIIQPALMTGVGVGVTLLLIMFLLLKRELPHLPLGKAPLMPVWKRLLVVLYGGLTEEIRLRIFLVRLR